MQVKLLRVLDGRGYIPIGGDEARFADVRFIAATNRNLQECVQQGLMREDFFYRIHILPTQLPPLRDRKEDLPLLVEHFMEEFGKKSQLPPLTGEIMAAIIRHDWPGNVRELQNVLRRYVSLGDFSLVVSRDIPTQRNVLSKEDLCGVGLDDHRALLEQHEKNLIETSLINNNWHKANAAASIGMAKRTFFRKIKKYGLDKKGSQIVIDS
jgi:transcriptional regulator with PAS, ATPase and Fis domain